MEQTRLGSGNAGGGNCGSMLGKGQKCWGLEGQKKVGQRTSRPGGR
jgi:hypothetical protein